LKLLPRLAHGFISVHSPFDSKIIDETVSLSTHKSTKNCVAADSQISIKNYVAADLEIGSDDGVVSGFTFFCWVFTILQLVIYPKSYSFLIANL
jgi:hypothetical protein